MQGYSLLYDAGLSDPPILITDKIADKKVSDFLLIKKMQRTKTTFNILGNFYAKLRFYFTLKDESVQKYKIFIEA
jgi:hypothetical protein